MKKIFAITFSFLIFIQGAGLGVGDILLFGRLLEHAQCHSETYGDDFFTFLSKHYGSYPHDHENAHEQEDSKHKELPFQHEHCSHSIAEVVVIGYEGLLPKPNIPPAKEVNFFYLDIFSSFEKEPLFQPPRVA